MITLILLANKLKEHFFFLKSLFYVYGQQMYCSVSAVMGKSYCYECAERSKERGIKALQWNKTQMIDACTDTRPVLEIGFHKEEVKGKRLFSWTSHCGFIKRKYTRVIAIFTTVSRFEISVAV